MEKRLKFFEKDSIPKTKGRVWDQMKKLGEIKANNSALNGGKNAADYKRLSTNDDKNIYAVERSKDGNEVFFIANLSKDDLKTKINGLNGEYTDLMTGATVTLDSNKETEMGGYSYLLLEPKK
jgi:hypothetical protein